MVTILSFIKLVSNLCESMHSLIQCDTWHLFVIIGEII